MLVDSGVFLQELDGGLHCFFLSLFRIVSCLRQQRDICVETRFEVHHVHDALLQQNVVREAAVYEILHKFCEQVRILDVVSLVSFVNQIGPVVNAFGECNVVTFLFAFVPRIEPFADGVQVVEHCVRPHCAGQARQVDAVFEFEAEVIAYYAAVEESLLCHQH